MRSRVNSCRWPRLRREFFRRRFLKAMIFGPRPCSITSAATDAPATVGAPGCTLSPPTSKDLAELDDLSRFALDLVDLELVFGGNPVLLAARFEDREHLFVLVFDPGARIFDPDRLLAVDSVDGYGRRVTAPAVLMAGP